MSKINIQELVQSKHLTRLLDLFLFLILPLCYASKSGFSFNFPLLLMIVFYILIYFLSEQSFIRVELPQLILFLGISLFFAGLLSWQTKTIYIGIIIVSVMILELLPHYFRQEQATEIGHNIIRNLVIPLLLSICTLFTLVHFVSIHYILIALLYYLLTFISMRLPFSKIAQQRKISNTLLESLGSLIIILIIRPFIPFDWLKTIQIFLIQLLFIFMKEKQFFLGITLRVYQLLLVLLIVL